MRPKIGMVALLLLLSITFVAQPVAASHGEGHNALNIIDRMEWSVLQIGSSAGVIAIVSGAILYVWGSRETDKTSYGKRLVKGGAGLVVLTTAIQTIQTFLQWIGGA